MAEQFGVPGDPFRLAGDLSVDRLLGQFLEDHVDGDVGRGHCRDERHRARDLLVDLVAALLGHGGRFPMIPDREAEEIHVREEDRNGRDQAEDDEQREDRNL